jgi:nitroreductase
MEFKEALRRRRMVRNYTGDPVDGAVLDRIARAALRAPSAGYSQGVAVVAITDQAVKAKIAELADEPDYVAAGFDPWMSGAPAHLVICISEEAYHRRYQEPDKLTDGGEEIAWPIPYWWVDAGAALMLVLLAAVDEGLAAGFFGTHRLRGLSDVLGLPESMVPIGVVTIGHPAPDRRSGSLARGPRPDREVVHYDRWGQGKPTE